MSFLRFTSRLCGATIPSTSSESDVDTREIVPRSRSDPIFDCVADGNRRIVVSKSQSEPNVYCVDSKGSAGVSRSQSESHVNAVDTEESIEPSRVRGESDIDLDEGARQANRELWWDTSYSAGDQEISNPELGS